jgi:hypothetical protein
MTDDMAAAMAARHNSGKAEMTNEGFSDHDKETNSSATLW